MCYTLALGTCMDLLGFRWLLVHILLPVCHALVEMLLVITSYSNWTAAGKPIAHSVDSKMCLFLSLATLHLAKPAL